MNAVYTHHQSSCDAAREPDPGLVCFIMLCDQCARARGARTSNCDVYEERAKVCAGGSCDDCGAPSECEMVALFRMWRSRSSRRRYQP